MNTLYLKYIYRNYNLKKLQNINRKLFWKQQFMSFCIMKKELIKTSAVLKLKSSVLHVVLGSVLQLVLTLFGMEKQSQLMYCAEEYFHMNMHSAYEIFTSLQANFIV